jgi:hypothetical protein
LLHGVQGVIVPPPFRSRDGHHRHRADKERVPLTQHRSSRASRSVEGFRVMVQQAKKLSTFPGRIRLLFVGINNRPRSSMYKARRLRFEYDGDSSICCEPIQINDVYTFTNARGVRTDEQSLTLKEPEQ